MTARAKHQRVWAGEGVALVLGAVTGGIAWVRRGIQRRSTAGDQAMHLPGDGYLDGGPPARLVTTRAVGVDTPSEVVWPRFAQLVDHNNVGMMHETVKEYRCSLVVDELSEP